MSTEEKLLTVTEEAGADLSAKQYLFHVMSSDGQIDPCSVEGEVAYGVLQNKPDAAGKAATVAWGGVSKIVLGADSMTPGMKIQTSDAGKALEAAVGDAVLGTLRKGGDTNEIGEILLSPVTNLAS
jgi:hypothetical protein